MLAFPHAKINLGLSIIDKRADGFHNIRSVFYPVAINDALEILPADKFSFEVFGNVIEGNENTCVKAYQLLKKDFDLSPVKIILYKNIPMGAGLAGGSSDGAFALSILNEKLKLNLSDLQLKNYASQIGSDCPFFIHRQPMLISGRGEVMEEIPVDLSSYKIVIIYPGIIVNTAWAYKIWDERKSHSHPGYEIKNSIQQPVNEWKESLKNDFEELVFEKYPSIRKIKEQLYNAGAVYSSMSGSGSAVYGIFERGINNEMIEKNLAGSKYSIFFNE
jgi:4-diphosphocytidyl-2-C-methyl-D-erythritol kinase